MRFRIKFFLGVLVLFFAFHAELEAQKVVDIIIYARKGGKKVKNVDFSLRLNGKSLVSLTKRNGKFEFAIQPNDGRYNLFIAKEGHITKELTFKSSDYPFKEDYDVQEIEVDLIPRGEDMKDVVVSRNVGYSKKAGYIIQKLDSTIKVYKGKLNVALTTLEMVAEKAITNADGMVALEEYEYAKGYYEIALDIDPYNEYAKEQYDKMTVLAAEQQRKYELYGIQNGTMRGMVDYGQSVTRLTGQYYCVQVGAFLKGINEKKFKKIDQYRKIDGQDNYTRVLTGAFRDRADAERLMREMRARGFKDAFVVSMNGNKRIGF